MTPKISIEVEGKTVAEAIKKALKELKVPRDKVKIEVLTEEEKGLFGMEGAKLAKVRVSTIKNKDNS
ncbi:MAG: Jag N-terminal domain-containing protein [Candidatus Omnitrophota bacterium]|jgi:spoIIIJ-associated protein